MAYRVVFTPFSRKALKGITAYIAAESVKYSAMVMEKIQDVAQSLSEFAWAGRMVPELEDKMIRERFA